MIRREFLSTLPAWLVATKLASQSRPLRIDALGEIHLDYPMDLIDQIISTGMHGCVVTVGNPALHGDSAWPDMESEVDGYDKHSARHPERFLKATKAADFEEARRSNRLALLYYTQNATPLGDDLKRLEHLKQRGVLIVQLTYNTRNLLGDGCLERTNAGLSTFGVQVVERMNELSMLVDVSHTGMASTLDAIRLSKKPVAITHAGCKAVYDHPRNKTDEALKLLAERGGVIGIYQINPYLGPQERNTMAEYVAHIEHAVNVAGIDHVAIGSDREHRTIPDTPEEKQKLIEELSRLRPVTASNFRWPFFLSELNHPRRMATIAEALERRRWKAADIEKVLGLNFLRLVRETIG